ncbi:MAG: glycine betaine ABC transporter substrate-binding protein, partial [Desulfonatronovibrionaceae bacterium]
VTGWTPHWKFAKWDLKYLEDPEKVFGEEEYIGTFVRKGLKEDRPKIYNFLDNFYWEPEDMEQVMLWAQDEDTTYSEAARRWVEKNGEKVKGWIKD